MLHALNDAARAFLDGPHFAVLATVSPRGNPQQSVMWYLVEGDEILFNTKRGRVKEKNLARNAEVSLCIADGYRYITIRGVVRIIEDRDTTQADIERLAARYTGPEKAAQRARDQFNQEERISYRVPLDQVTVYGFDE
ncbi:MAG TPA: PPOX class F420-dependent oxidoreductase [Chloroflexia bacterium]|nr:PPOX class F420-dependent oxidoreductase [Chloroflexia bacterium]